MPLAEDVLGILEELRAAGGTFPRARIIGRLWGAARALPSDERRQLATILAERYAPKLVDRLTKGGEIESVELLGMIRTLGSVDADELTEIMEQLRDPEGRRALLAQTVESLQDDVAEADVDELMVNPEARTALLSEAVSELIEDLEAPTEAPEPDGHTPLAPAPETAQADTPHLAGPEEGIPAPIPETAEAEMPVSAPGRGGEEAEAEMPEEAEAETPPSAKTPATEPGPPPAAAPPVMTAEEADQAPLPSGEMTPTPGDDRPAPAPAPQQEPSITPHDLRGAASPLARLRMLTLGLTRPPTPSQVGDLVKAFPDGWQRRRAVAAVCRVLDPADPGGRQVAEAALACLERPVDRRWIVNTLAARWSLGSTDRARLVGSPVTGCSTHS